MRGLRAILLCRVAMGKAHLVSASSDREATEKAASKGCDSTVASPTGNPREFIVFSPDQVYPEYSIIYDVLDSQLHDMELDLGDLRGGDAGRPAGDELPAYWENTGASFDDVYPVRIAASGGLTNYPFHSHRFEEPSLQTIPSLSKR